MMREDFAPYRDELIISSKAGYDMWPGPYGDGGSRKYILASAEQSLQRMSVDYVDIFYSHRVDPVTSRSRRRSARSTPWCGRARPSTSASRRTARSARRSRHRVARSLGTPLVIHQPSYSILNRWVEDGLTGRPEAGGHGRDRVHAARAGPAHRQVPRRRHGRARAAALVAAAVRSLSEKGLATLRGLDVIAKERGQTLAQLAIQWVLRDPVVASALIGASRPAQLDENLAALDGPAFDAEELERIDALSDGIDVDLWAESAQR